MRPLLVLLGPVLLIASESPVDRMFDTVLTAAQRNQACFELRGDQRADTLDAMRRALNNDQLQACAAMNLRVAGGVEQLQQALDDPSPEVRAVVARELGYFQSPKLLEALSQAAQDPNLLVATNAIQGLIQYQDAIVIPYLLEIAKRGGITGVMALDRATQLKDPGALTVARALLASPAVTDRIAAMRVIGQMGDRSDLSILRVLAAKKEEVSARQRGFGLLPRIDLARAAKATITEIEARI